MKTEDIIEGLLSRFTSNKFKDYLLIVAISRLQTLQLVSKQRDKLLAALEFTKDAMIANNLNYEAMPRTFEVIDEAIANAKEEE